MKVNDDSVNVVARHLDYTVKNGIDVTPEQEVLPSFYWFSQLHKTTYCNRFIAASNKCTTYELYHYLHLASRPY